MAQSSFVKAKSPEQPKTKEFAWLRDSRLFSHVKARFGVEVRPGLKHKEGLTMKVLVSDSLAEIGITLLQETPGIEVDVNTDLTPEELTGIIGQYHALVIRSSTRVTADIIEAARSLKVIGRAGIGLDNAGYN